MPTFPCIALRLLNSQRSPPSIIFHNSTLAFVPRNLKRNRNKRKFLKKTKKQQQQQPPPPTMDSQPLEPLDALRALMDAHLPPLHAVVVPSEDAHQVRLLLSCPFFFSLPSASFLTSSLFFCKLCFYPKHTYTHYVIVFLLGSWLLLRSSLCVSLWLHNSLSVLLDCIVCGLLRGFWQASFVFLVGTRFCTTCFCRFSCFFSKEKIDVALLLFGANVGADFGFELVPNGNWQFCW